MTNLAGSMTKPADLPGGLRAHVARVSIESGFGRGSRLLSSSALRRCLYLGMAVCLGLEAASLPFAQGLNPDSVAYLDLADAAGVHAWARLVNAYWHPGYPVLLALMRSATRLPLSRELESARLMNLLVGLGLLLAVRFLVAAALDVRAGRQRPLDEDGFDSFAWLERGTVQLFAAAITFLVLMRDLDFASVRPDTLLAVLLVLAAGSMLRVVARPGLTRYTAVGLCFGLAFLVKSVAFPLFLLAVLLLVLVGWRSRVAESRMAAGVGLTVVIFALVAGPYIAAISKQKGRFTAGDSGALNYAWCVDGAQGGGKLADDPLGLGLATGALKHVPERLTERPALYFYPEHWDAGEDGWRATSSRWIMPAYWGDGLRPRFHSAAQLRSIGRGLSIVGQYLLLRSQILLLVALWLVLGGQWRWRSFGLAGMGVVLVLAAAQLGMYVLVAVEPRYIGAAVLLVLVSGLVCLRVPEGRQTVFRAVSFVFLALLLCGSFTESLQQLKRNRAVNGSWLGSYEPNVFGAAEALTEGGRVRVGDPFASLVAWDYYWARLARVSVVVEEDASVGEALGVWKNADRVKLLAALRGKGIRGIVAEFGANADAPAGWVRLGSTDYFVLYL